MKTVSIINEKGGTGKTFISNELYYAFTQDGLATSLYSLDGQYEDRTVKAKNAKVSVVDTAGAITSDIEEVIKKSDCIVVPVIPSANNVEPFTRTMDIITKKTKVPVLVVVNMSNNYTSSKSFLNWLAKKNWVKDYISIPQSEIVRQSEAKQCSVLKIDKRKVVTGAIKELYEKVCKALKIS